MQSPPPPARGVRRRCPQPLAGGGADAALGWEGFGWKRQHQEALCGQRDQQGDWKHGSREREAKVTQKHISMSIFYKWLTGYRKHIQSTDCVVCARHRRCMKC